MERHGTTAFTQARRRAAVLAMAVVPVALAGCEASVLGPAGPVGAAERTILLNSLAIMLCIVVPTIVATLAFAWWFRASNARARRLPEFTFSGRVELVTWSIPVLTICFLGGIAWVGAHDLDPGAPVAGGAPDGLEKPLEVEVVSLDWKWLFILPEQNIALINQLTIPTGRPVHFSLTSASVMNCFFVPRLGSMIYTMNGMVEHLNLRADRAGTYEGLSTHFSGDGFPGMHFKLQVVDPAAFDAWAKSIPAASPASLDAAAYARLARQSIDDAPSAFGGVQRDLFHQIAMQAIPPAPGPEGGRPKASVSPKTKS